MIDQIVTAKVDENEPYVFKQFDKGNCFFIVNEGQFAVIVDEKEENRFEVQSTNSIYRVVTEDFIRLDIDIYTADGRLLKSENIITNTDYDLPQINGIGVLCFHYSNEQVVHKFVKVN